jgi:hypothetical protein
VDARVQCEFTSDFANTKGQLVSRDVRHAQAAVLFDDVPPSREIVRMTEPAAWQTAIYPERESLLYHGPVFRRLRRVAFDDSGLWAEIEVGPNAELGGQRRPDRWMYYPAVLDACFFACGIYYWLRHERAIILPSSLGDLRMMRLPRVSERCLARVLPRGIDHSQPPMTFARFDVTLYGADGAPIFEVHDYRAMASSGSGPRSTRPQ